MNSFYCQTPLLDKEELKVYTTKLTSLITFFKRSLRPLMLQSSNRADQVPSFESNNGGLPQAQELGPKLLPPRPLNQRLEATGGARWWREEGPGMWSSPGTRGPGPRAQVEALGEEEEELKEEEE